MAVVDHLIIVLLFVVQPIHGAWAWRRFVARIEAGQPAARTRLYRQTLVLEWFALGVLASVWLNAGRPFADLGIVVPGGPGFLAGVVILAAATAWLVYAWRKAIHASDDDRAAVIDALGRQRHLMPHSVDSYRWFFGLSITAGVVEEIVYRGFVFWYLAQLLPIWAVVVVSAIAFGLGHSYQGLHGMLRITLVGVAFGAYYLLTGSIWLPIVAHALVDVLQGAMIFEYLRPRARQNAGA